jgi:hypothetical protein
VNDHAERVPDQEQVAHVIEDGGDRRGVGGQADDRLTALAGGDVRRGEAADEILAVSGQGGVPLRVT